MARQDKFFDKLKKIFTDDNIIVFDADKKIKVLDPSTRSELQKTNWDSQLNFRSSLESFGRQYQQKSFNVNRKLLYTDYELMDMDALISSALDIYSEESTTENIDSVVLEVTSENEEIKQQLENLFDDILNVDSNLALWIRNMCKYGNMFLRLNLHSEYGVTSVFPLNPYNTERIEENQEIYFEVENNRQESYEVAHFRLPTDANFWPHGKSIIEGARRTWQALQMMEDAMLIHRIMRAPEKRIFKVDIGNIQPDKIDSFMNDLISKIKKVPYVDQNTGNYNLRYNMENITEDVFLPVRGGDSGTEVRTLEGQAYDAIEDIEYLKRKIIGQLKIPPAFLGLEGEEAKATIAAQDIRFARTIHKIQKNAVEELKKIAIIHLLGLGYRSTDITDFDLKLNNPSTIHEQEKLALLDEQLNVAEKMKDSKMFTTDQIFKQVFNKSEEEVEQMKPELVEDRKFLYRLETIETEGVDPDKQKVPLDDEEDDEDKDEEELDAFEKDMDTDDPFRDNPKTPENKRETHYDKFKKNIEKGAEERRKLIRPDDANTSKRQFKGGSPLSRQRVGTEQKVRIKDVDKFLEQHLRIINEHKRLKK